MKRQMINSLLVLLSCFCWLSCADDEAPQRTVPTVSVDAASDVTRTTATLSGRIEAYGSYVKECGFMYSDKSENDLHMQAGRKVPVSTTSGKAEVALTNLQPNNTTYYYCMYVTCGISTILSDIKSFTTNAIDPPTLSSVSVTEKDAFSITVQYSLEFNGGSSVDEVGIEYREAGAGGYTALAVGSFDEESGTTTFTQTLAGLKPGQPYEIRAYATNTAKEKGYSDGGAPITVTTDAINAPTLSIAAQGKGTYSFTVRCTVESDGGDALTEMGIEYWKKGDSENVIKRAVEKFDKGSSNQFTVQVSSLSSGTEYEVRAYAVNSQVTGSSQSITIATDAINAPEVGLEVLSQTTKSITVKGSLASDGGSSITEYGIEYRKKGESTFTKQEVKKWDDGSAKTFTLTIDNLSSGTEYEVRAYAKNAEQTGNSEVKSVTTVAILAPTVSIVAQGKDIYSFTVRCTVESDGGDALAEMGIEYWKRGDSGNVTKRAAGAFDNGKTFTLTIGELQPSTTYEVRAYAANAQQTGRSQAISITTDVLLAPTLTTYEVEAGNIGKNWFTVAGIVESTGTSSEISEKGFCYSVSKKTPTIVDNVVVVTTEAFVATLSNLTPGTTYYVRAYAKNQVDGKTNVGYGEVRAVTTQALAAEDTPSLSNLQVTDVTSSTFTASTSVASSDDYPVTEVGFCWSDNANDSAEKAYQKNKVKATLGTDNTFKSSFSQMTPGHTYVVYAYAINGTGLVYSQGAKVELKHVPGMDDKVSPDKK